MLQNASSKLIQPAIRVVAAGLGAVVAGPLGLALGGLLGDTLGKPASDLIETYLGEFGKEASKKIIETGGDSLAKRLEQSKPDLTNLYCEALRRGLAAIRPHPESPFSDWFANWDACMQSSDPLQLEEIQPDQLNPDKLDGLFRHTLERLDAQGAAIKKGSRSLTINCRDLPVGLLDELTNRLPASFKENFEALILTGQYEKAWKQAEREFQLTTTNLLRSIKDDTKQTVNGIDTANKKLDELLSKSSRGEKPNGESGPVPSLFVLDPFATVPPLPPSFIPRPEVTEPLIATLLSNSAISNVTAVEGMGGVGKTIVALSLCYDPRIRDAFSDGIVWLNIGNEPTFSLMNRMERVARALNQEFREYSKDAFAYSTLFTNKAVLVVLDDVWSPDAIEPFIIPRGRSRLLYTSRDKGIAGPLGARPQDVGVLDSEQARTFLARWSGREDVPLPEPYASEILAACKGLALGLSMVGAALKGKPDQRWAFLADDLKKANLRVGAPVAGYLYKTLHASIEVSINSLESSAKTHYLQLAVLLDDMPAPPALLQALWGGSERVVDDLICLLVERSLASRDANDSIRIHDLQLDYIRGEHTDHLALELERTALLRSLHVIQADPQQFTSQMTGRLLAHHAQPAIAAFIKGLDECAPLPQLRPLRPALDAAGNPARRVLETRPSSVLAVALTPDGRRAVFGMDDCTIRVWDLDGNLEPLVLEGHTGSVLAVALSEDGRRAVSGSQDRTLRVWDLDGNQKPLVLKGHTGSVLAVALTKDRKRAISGSVDMTLRIWDLENLQPPRVLEGHRSWVRAIALTPDGSRFVSGSKDGRVLVWDLERDQPPRVLEGHSGSVNSVALTPDGRFAISGSQDKTLLVWDLESNRQPHVLEGHVGSVFAVALTPDGRRAVAGAGDRTLSVWDLEGSEPPRFIRGHFGTIYAVALTNNGFYAISGSDDKTLRLWDLEDHQPPPVSGAHLGPIYAVALTPDGHRAISGSRDKTLRVWDLKSDQLPRVLGGHSDWVRAVALSPDGRRAISGSDDKTLRVWDMENNYSPRVLEGHSGCVFAVALTPDGHTAVSGSQDGTLRVWDLAGTLPPRILDGHSSWVRAVALTPDGRFAISGSQDKTLRVWDLESNRPPQVLEGHLSAVLAVALTSDGHFAISGSQDKTLRIWDLRDNWFPRVLEGHSGAVFAVALRPDGYTAVSGSQDCTLRVWNLHTRKCLTVFTCDAPVYSCAWSGTHVVAGDANGQLHCFEWNA